jgi:predicted Zn-dependent protease
MKPASPDFNCRAAVFPFARVSSDAIANFERLLEAGRDSALLRFSLGGEYLKIGDSSVAVQHLEHAVALDPKFSAAWKLLGRALTECGRCEQALAAYERGIGVATANGDKQAAKEMAVFAKRLAKLRGPS